MDGIDPALGRPRLRLRRPPEDLEPRPALTIRMSMPTAPRVGPRPVARPAGAAPSVPGVAPRVARSEAPGPARLRAAERIEPPEAPALNLRHDDPRWVLAVRTSQVLTGAMVRPADREALIRVGRALGLDTFQSNLIIAMVQDQARRGRGPEGASQLLRYVRPAAQGAAVGDLSRAWRIAMVSAALIATEVLAIMLVV